MTRLDLERRKDVLYSQLHRLGETDGSVVFRLN